MSRIVFCIALLLSSVLADLTIPALAAAQTQQSRDEAKKAIRATAYEMMKAFLTSDVEVFKRHAAKRTLDLINLVYEAALQDPRYQQELRNAQISNREQFLSYFLRGLANRYLQVAPMTPEAAARRAANDSTVSFVSDSEAKIFAGDSEFARARLVARQWRIDLTDAFKKAVLEEIRNPEIRARIKSL